MEQLTALIRQASANVGVPLTYFGRIGDFSLTPNAAGITPVLVVEPPTGSSVMLAANAKQEDISYKLYLLDDDKEESGFDQVIENDASAPAREVIITNMAKKMDEFVWALTKLVNSSGEFRMISPSSLNSYDQYTDKVLAGVGRVVTIRAVSVICG